MELKPLFKDIADAIRQKDGTVDPITASSFPERIKALPDGSSVTASPKDINFFDYNGILLYSYTLSEAHALTDLPKPPVHDGLVFQGWNWSLEKIKVLTRPMNVGAMYITDDGKTRLKIRVWDKARSNVPLCIAQTVSNGVTIDWGDGSSTETLDGTGRVNTTHQYASEGEYTIVLTVTDGCYLVLGWDSSSSCVMGSVDDYNVPYRNLLQSVRIGKNVTNIGGYAFFDCRNLESITIPYGVIGLGYGAFYNCTFLRSLIFPDGVSVVKNALFNDCCSLEIVSIPDGVPNVGNRLFRGCRSMRTITIPNSIRDIGNSAFLQCGCLMCFTIPDGVTAILYSAFGACDNLINITIPEGVITIEREAFYNCTGVTEYHLKPTIPPTLENINAFNGISSDCIIYVPAGSLEVYKTMENWSAYADHMQEE